MSSGNVYKKFLQEEYRNYKVLGLCCHGPGQLHTITKEVQTLEDLKGLRIRVADKVLAQAVSELGGIPVICTVSGIEKLARQNKIDGFLLPWEGLTSFQLTGIAKHHTEINMYTLPIYFLMNKKSYEELPAHLQKIIDETTGEPLSIAAGKAFDIKDKEVRSLMIQQGHTIHPLTPPRTESMENTHHESRRPLD